MSNPNNPIHAFADVLSVDAWHAELNRLNPEATLHVDAVFSTGRIGGEAESPVRFRMSLKRAEIVVVKPESEQVGTKIDTVERDGLAVTGKETKKQETTTTTAAKIKAQATTSITKFNVALAAEAEAGRRRTETDTLETEGTISLILATQSKTRRGDYRWVLTPGSGRPSLEGRPWDAKSKPRLTITDERKSRYDALAPVVRVEVNCRREDIEITDIQIKEPGIFPKPSAAKLKAVEAEIRRQLCQAGLPQGEISDPFIEIKLVSLYPTPVREA